MNAPTYICRVNQNTHIKEGKLEVPFKSSLVSKSGHWHEKPKSLIAKMHGVHINSHAQV